MTPIREELLRRIAALQLKPIADIPNREGFLFCLIREDDQLLSARVEKGADGCHKVIASGPFNLETCKGWKDWPRGLT